jgi:hypothetical protein
MTSEWWTRAAVLFGAVALAAACAGRSNPGTGGMSASSASSGMCPCPSPCGNDCCGPGFECEFGTCNPAIKDCYPPLCGLLCGPCPNPHGTCEGPCLPVCAAGFADCDGNIDNGCEINTQVDANHCGACGTVCTAPAGNSPVCIGGVCDVCGPCPSPFICCGSICGTNPLTDPNNCGACGVECMNANGSTACVSGVCTPTCAAGSADCDGNPNNGCEANLSTDPANCGHCNVRCGVHANCSGGVCVCQVPGEPVR